MQLIKLTCCNCNAPLEIDLDRLMTYCPYCGQKLMIDSEQLAWILAEKEKTKRIAEQEAHQTLRRQLEYQEKESERKNQLRIIVFALSLMFVFFLITMLPLFFFK